MLIGAVQLVLCAAGLVCAVPVCVLLFQVWLARGVVIEPVPPAINEVKRPIVAVLVPAHNEQEVIESTLRTLLPQLQAGDRLLVVADNCTDDTAHMARAAGAEVVERSHASDRGKGFALDFGVRYLSRNPPDVLVIVDADCQVEPGSLPQLANLAVAHGRPVQALDLMLPNAAASLKQRLAAWAWRVKNWARPLGWHRLGWPCQLMGTGMAFPWSTVQGMDLANGHLVEDMKLGADLALADTPPLFCPSARVTSEFPSTAAAQQSQRKRWEHGHLSVLLSLGPKLLWRGFRAGNVAVLAMALDLLVPPLALLAVVLSGLWLASLALVLVAGKAWAAPLVLATLLVLLFQVTLWQAWRGWGRDLVSAREWLSVPGYMLAKLPIYVGYLFRRQKAWVRTERK